jgi:hypothetical protein
VEVRAEVAQTPVGVQPLVEGQTPVGAVQPLVEGQTPVGAVRQEVELS